MNVQAGRHALWILAAVLLAAAAVDHAAQTASAQLASGATQAAGTSDTGERPATAETRALVPSRTATGNGPTGSSPDGVSARESSVGKPGFVYIPGANGELIPVLQNSTFEEFLKWLRERDQPALPAAVESGITSISFDGQVVENRAILDATIQIQVNVADRWQEVPIYCNEAVLLQADYEGPGETVPGDTPQRNTGYHWWVRGKGTHTVKLKLSLPVAVQVPVSRVQLTLPATPLSVLRMRVPMAGISAKGPDRASLSTRTVSETQSEILVYGLGPRLDVSYRPLPATNATELVLQAATTLAVELSSDSALIRGVQKVQALQGSFESIEVQLPQGFDLLDFESQDYRDYDVTEDNRAIVTLREPTTGPVELRWTVQSEQAAEDNVWILGGFDVLHARRHMGDVSVFPAEGFKVTAPEAGSRFVHRVNVSDLNGRNQGSAAFRFLKQPFQLELQLTEIEPYFSVEPHVFVKLSGQEVAMDARFEIDVYRGTLRELVLEWPDHIADGWVLDTTELPALVEEAEPVNAGDQDDMEPDRLRIRLVRRASGHLTIPLRAKRPIPARNEAFSLNLPSPIAPSRLPTRLVVANADNVESEILPVGETLMRSLRPERRVHLEVPAELASLRRTELQVSSAEQRLLATVNVHPQQIATESFAEFSLTEDHLIVTQRIVYDVSYERLLQARLFVPTPIADRVHFTMANDETLPVTWNTLDIEGRKQARITFPEPKIGRFTVIAVFPIPLPATYQSGGVAEIQVPLAQSSDAPFSSLQLGVRPDSGVNVNVLSDGWERRFTMEHDDLWRIAGSPGSVLMQFDDRRAAPAQDFSVPKALIRTVIDAQGQPQSRVQFRVEGVVSSILLSVPKDIQIEGIWWNSLQLAEQALQPVPGDDQKFQLMISDVGLEGRNLLTIDFHPKTARRPSWFAEQTLSVPQLASDVWVARTLWEFVLPYQSHLFTEPAGLSPQFRWQFDRILFRRITFPEVQDSQAWIDVSQGPDGPAGFQSGNHYKFLRFGSATQAKFYTMGRSGIVLLGAGLALMLGVTLLKIPATRNILTLLVLGFLTALAGLWYPAPVEVLLQPALLGLTLACLAVLIDSLVKRRAPAAGILTISTPSDYLSAKSSVSRQQISGAGDDEVTEVRNRPHSSVHEPVSSAESGGHL